MEWILVAVALGMLLMAAVAVAVVMGGLYFVWRRDDRELEEEAFSVDRIWPWELEMTEAAETQFMADVEAFDDEVNSIDISKPDGLATIYTDDAQKVVSISTLVKAWEKSERTGADAIEKALENIENLVLSEDWYPETATMFENSCKWIWENLDEEERELFLDPVGFSAFSKFVFFVWNHASEDYDLSWVVSVVKHCLKISPTKAGGPDLLIIGGER